ncbi:MAG: hypothetical protein WBO55_03000 [Rhizobiaceae bacterium]
MPSGTYHNPNQKHLFVVCTDPDNAGNVLIVSISSWKSHLCDATCKLENGCHPFIAQESYVLYRKSRVEPASAIEKGIRTGTLVQKDDFGAELVGRMLSGVLASKQTPWKISKYVKALAKR